MFQEVFTDTVEYVVERVQSNYALQVHTRHYTHRLLFSHASEGMYEAGYFLFYLPLLYLLSYFLYFPL